MSSAVTIDQKGRLKIPATILAHHREFGTEFYITSEIGDCMRIYSLEVWNEIVERLERLSSQNRNGHKLLARAKYFGQTVSIDKQDRVLIPVVLREVAQLSGGVDVLDYQNYLEVWNHARLLKNHKCNPITIHDEKTLEFYLAALSATRKPDQKRPGQKSAATDRRTKLSATTH